MRISDWSSDVCSSDLRQDHRRAADPHVAAEGDRLRAFHEGGALDGIERMDRRVDLHRRAEQRLGTDLDARADENDAAGVDVDAVAQMGGHAVGPTTEEGREGKECNRTGKTRRST